MILQWDRVCMGQHRIGLLLIFAVALFNGCHPSSSYQSSSLPTVPYDLEIIPVHDPSLGSYFIVGGEISAEYPEPRREFRAALICSKGWRRLGKELEERYRYFHAWVDSTAAEINNKSFSLKDIRVSCENDGSIRIKSRDFRRSLALLAESVYGERKLSRGTGDEKAYLEFYSSGHNLQVWILPEEMRGMRGDPPILGDERGISMARQDGKDSPLFFESKTGVFEYDSSKVVEVIVERHPQYGEPVGFWDILRVHYSEGWFTWRQTSSKPF